MIGVLARGYRANLLSSFFLYCFRVFFPFVFSFARGGGEIGAANKVMELKGCLVRGYVNYVNTEILKGIRGNFCTIFPSR